MLCSVASAQSLYQSSADFAKHAAQLRESAMLKMEPQVVIPTTARTLGVSGRYPWKTRIVTTASSIGKSSAWDPQWRAHFGGYDSPNPGFRRGYIPASFIPRQNPFYVALPYNDVTPTATKAEARVVIPWFHEAFVEEGKSVCRDRWLAIRNSNTGKICYAQWSDCGPFRTDHWQYVFGNERPKPNANQGSGLNVSPAVRYYLGLGGTDVTDWKFVETREVPNGPWSQFGDNNDFVKNARRAAPAAPPDYLDPANNAQPVHQAATPRPASPDDVP